MIPQPLHPAVVHFPIVLVMILPLAAIVAVLAIRRGASVRRAWVPVVVTAFALAGSAWFALQTGEREEEVVEEVVAASAIHDHEEAAELFLGLSAVVLLLGAVGLVTGRAGEIARPAVVVAALLLVGAGYRVGHSGGALVYEHGAAQAYAVSPDRAPSGSESGEPSWERDDDDRDRRSR